MGQCQFGGAAEDRGRSAVHRQAPLQELPHRPLAMPERKLQVLETGLAVVDQVRRRAVRGIGKQRRRVDQRELLRRHPREVRKFTEGLRAVRPARQFGELRPVEPEAEREEVDEEAVERPQLALAQRQVHQHAQFALERWREVLSLVEEPGQKHQGVERLPAGAQRRHELAGALQFAQPEQSLHAVGSGVGQVLPERFPRPHRDEERQHRRAALAGSVRTGA
jgi:hypothetical protein